MSKPYLTVKYRGVGLATCDVYQSSGGALTYLFSYGTGNQATDTDHKPSTLAAHWAGKIYAISPEEGIYVNTPPSNSASLLHPFTLPNTGNSSYVMGWQTVFKDGKMQLFTMYLTTTSNRIRMVFIDENGSVTETGQIVVQAPALNMSYMRGFYFDNKIYTTSMTTSNLDIQITDPESEVCSQINVEGLTYHSADFASHSGSLYYYTNRDITTVGIGNALWSMDNAVPTKILEWNANHVPGPGIIGQCCVFSDGQDLILAGIGSGTSVSDNDEYDMWKVNFDVNGVPIGLTSIRDTVLGFTEMDAVESCRFYANRDIESELGVINTDLFVVTGAGSTEGTPIHQYRWNGANQQATYVGIVGDSYAFDAPSDKMGGGAQSYSNESELDFIVTGTANSGVSLNVTYLLTGDAPAGSIAMSVRFNNLKDSPLGLATVAPADNGFSSGIYIAGLSTGSGILNWDIATDKIVSTRLPTLSAFLIRT